MRLTKEQADAIRCGDSNEFVVIDQGNWQISGMYDIREIVFQRKGKVPKLENGVRGFRLRCRRMKKRMSLRLAGSGSNDPYYDYVYDCPEVERVPCVGYKWEEVKAG